MIDPRRLRYTSSFAVSMILTALLGVFFTRCDALTITAPTREDGVGRSLRSRSRVDTNTHITKHRQLEMDLRIRSTVEGDIKKIAEILTHELLQDDEKERNHLYQAKLLDFKFRGTYSDVKSLLQSRMDAIQIGRNFYRKESTRTGAEAEADRLKMLWNNETFRTHVETAALLSNEPHFWKDHNFYCAPESFDWFFHKMITAENTLTGEIVGFCEIAMLAEPMNKKGQTIINGRHEDIDSGSKGDEECSLVKSNAVVVPTIINLVTCKEYRRCGVGSSIVNSALNYARRTASPSKTIALYVEEENIGAISMYKRLGFEMRRLVKSSNQLYMTHRYN